MCVLSAKDFGLSQWPTSDHKYPVDDFTADLRGKTKIEKEVKDDKSY